jgi:Antibiotic biosynthesis monooxygenase
VNAISHAARATREVRVTARFPHVWGVDLAQFKKAAAHALEVARGEPGVLRYDWFFDDTETVCLVRETYEDSEALLAHIANLGETFDTLSQLGGGCELEMFGNPSAQLLDATPPSRRTLFRASFQGK